MRSISLTLLAALMIFAGGINAQDAKLNTLTTAQVAKLDLNGKWSGKRYQYNWDKKSFIETFQYEFDLKQEGNIVTGTSTIISANGEYADMKLEGVIIENKLHFREYEVSGAIRPEGKLWCFKSGELNIVKAGDQIKLSGATASYMEGYNYPCSGGETDLVKVDNSNNTVVLAQIGSPVATASVQDVMQINIFPNPYIDNATISYNLTEDAKVRVELFDLSGKRMAEVFEGNQKVGNYQVTVDGKMAASTSGIVIVKMTINGEVFSRNLVQMK